MNKLRLKHLRSKAIKYIRMVDQKGKISLLSRPFIRQKPLSYAEQLESAEPITLDWPKSIPKPIIGLVQERIHRHASWPKYERFLKHNNIPYDYFNIHRSDFITKASSYDLIIWHTLSSFADQWEAKSKIEFLEREMNVTCFPTSDSLWFYEDKIRQQWLFEKHNIRAIKTFISFSKEETIEFINNCKYPIVSKEATNSGSEGVFLLKNQAQALKFCHKVFGAGHKVHSSTYLRQKNYVLFQEFIPSDGYDLRIIIIGNNYFGYYRDIPKGDFRASGSGIVSRHEIPNEALHFARLIQEKLPPTHYLSVDLIKNSSDNHFYVIEVSLFNKIETSEQLIFNDTPGRFIFENDEFVFQPGRVWVQELTLFELFTTWLENQRTPDDQDTKSSI